MKKKLIILFIISIICSILILLILWKAPLNNSNNSDSFSNIREKYGDEMGDVEGYAYLIEIAGAFGVEFGNIIFLMLSVLIFPALILITSIVCQIISLLFQIGKNKKWKDITSTVFICISFLILLLLFYLLRIIYIVPYSINKTFVFIAFFISLIYSTMHVFTIVNMIKLIRSNYKNKIDSIIE